MAHVTKIRTPAQPTRDRHFRYYHKLTLRQKQRNCESCTTSRELDVTYCDILTHVIPIWHLAFSLFLSRSLVTSNNGATARSRPQRLNALLETLL